ncbi:MAG: hypothetical protein II992_07935 [Lachnospiraceae bacterium]|nr:hypothetical protein [Lachnospiraceae bacterium]
MNKLSKDFFESEITEIDKSDFKKFIDKQREKRRGEVGYNYNRRKYYPLDLIAKNLGITKEMLQKRINKQKPTNKRDFVIALCAVLGCDSDETNTAMRLYNYMPAFDVDNARDDCIIEFLEEHAEQISSIEDINSFLVNRNYPELNIIDHRSKRNSVKNPEVYRPYKVVKKAMRIYYDEGDQYDSLETAYDFRNKCATVFLIEKNNGTNILLEAWSDGELLIDSHTDCNLPKIFYNPDDTEEYRDYFIEMYQLAVQEQQKIDAYLNDTRNYPFRLGAELENDTIRVFYEQYNYAFPERNEYYLMEYIDKQFILSVSTQSMFMREYLSEDEYGKHFRTNSNIKRITYNSIFEIENQLENSRLQSYDIRILKSRLAIFKCLQRKVTEALEQIRDRKIFIRNLGEIWSSKSDEVCRYFHVEKEYECIYDEGSDEIFAGKSNAELTDGKGNMVIVSLEELKRAFELGFKDVSQICRVKLNSGSIEAVLE